MTGDPYCETHGQWPCGCSPSQNLQNTDQFRMVIPIERQENMEDKHLNEVVAILKTSVDNIFIKDHKKLAKLKIDILKAITAAGMNLPLA